MKKIILETLIDSIELLPFLFITFLLIELFEHKFSNKSKDVIKKAGKLGPLFGSLLGIIPQCGFSVMATNLYITRIISLGTLIAVYLSTSDEMLPILLAEKSSITLIIEILAIKIVIAIILGFIIDLLLRKKSDYSYSICEEEHCKCEESMLLASTKHTISIFVFIIISTFIINCLLEFIGIDYLENMFLKNNIFGSIITSFIGLIPNCGASVIITELFLNKAISFGALIGGVLTGAGVAILVLFKESSKKYETIKIIALLYLIGALSGILIDIIIKII